MDTSYVWPDSFPEYVPPPNSIEASGVVFRISNNLPPTPSDFKQTRDEEKNKDRVYKGKHLANSYGVSVFADVNDAKDLISLFKNRMSENFYIVKGDLIPTLGKMAQTYKNSHHTIWFQKNSEPHQHINEEVE